MDTASKDDILFSTAHKEESESKVEASVELVIGKTRSTIKPRESVLHQRSRTLINPKPKRQEKPPPPKIADDSSSSFTPKSNQGGGPGTLLSPSKTNEERVARIIKDLNW